MISEIIFDWGKINCMFEDLNRLKTLKKNVPLLLLLYFYFIAGDFSFDSLTGMYFFLVPPLPLPATFQVTNFSA